MFITYVKCDICGLVTFAKTKTIEDDAAVNSDLANQDWTHGIYAQKGTHICPACGLEGHVIVPKRCEHINDMHKAENYMNGGENERRD